MKRYKVWVKANKGDVWSVAYVVNTLDEAFRLEMVLKRTHRYTHVE